MDACGVEVDEPRPTAMLLHDDVAEAQAEGKPPAAIEKIVEGKINKYLQQVCLVDQPFVKNPDQTITDLLTEKIQKIGENIKIKRFSRFALGE